MDVSDGKCYNEYVEVKKGTAPGGSLFLLLQIVFGNFLQNPLVGLCGIRHIGGPGGQIDLDLRLRAGGTNQHLGAVGLEFQNVTLGQTIHASLVIHHLGD